VPEFDSDAETIGFGYINGLESIWISYDFLVTKGSRSINVDREFREFLGSLIEQAKLQTLPKDARR